MSEPGQSQLDELTPCEISGCEWLIHGGGRCQEHGGPAGRYESYTNAFGNVVVRYHKHPAPDSETAA